MKKYEDTIGNELLIFDGAMGTNIQTQGLSWEDFGSPNLEGCNEVLVLSKPEAIKSIHKSFLDAGVNVIETDTFGAFSVVLSEYKIAEKAGEINYEAARLAREVASEYENLRPIFVAGSVGPGTKFPSLGQIPFDELIESYQEQIESLIAGGVDLILIETVFDLLQAKSAILAARKAMAAQKKELPIQVQVTIELTGRMLPGTEIGAALTSLYAMGPQVIGINCATGPVEMLEPLRYLSEHCPLPISCLPNAGLPKVVDSKMHYDLTPKELADYHHQFVTELGIEIVGGCCGTTPEHLKEVVVRLDSIRPKARTPVLEPSCASLYSPVTFKQESSILVIGERTNANGSKKFRQAMIEQNYNETLVMAKEQIGEGAHLIDVCVDYTGRDGVKDMSEIMKLFSTGCSVPIVIDSTEAPVVETALKFLGGRAVINSVNLEEGDGPGTRLDKFLKLAKDYGAAVICTCIDTRGQARTADWKLEAAVAIRDLAVNKYGLSNEDLLFDPLVLPLSTGMEESRKDGIETIKGISLIKENIKGCHTVVGLSNVSFGLNPALRQMLNSVFLYECQKAGLDAAIVHAGKILPLGKIPDDVKELCLDLIYDRRSDNYDPLAKLLEVFANKEEIVGEKEDYSLLPIEQRLEQRIVDGEKKGLEQDLQIALDNGYSAIHIINEFLLKGMKTVGDLFGSGQMQLPFVLQSAETMKQAVKYLEPFMEKSDSTDKGSIVLATVAGDVHDIGKNLVDIILSNNGFKVYNLGIKVGINEMLNALIKNNADALGMSGLLVKSTLIMKDNLEELNARDLSHVPVILGGAALTRTYVEKDLRSIYKGPVFYGKDAFEGLRTMNELIEQKKSGKIDPEFGRKIPERKLGPRKSEILAKIDPDSLPKRSPDVISDNVIFQPPFIGTRISKGIPLEDIASYLNETSLFRNQWGYRPIKGESDSEFKDRVRVELRKLLDEVKQQNILVPQVIWGYFPVNSVSNELIIYSDPERSKELTRFYFPRQKEAPYFSIADFFRDLDTGEIDYAAFQIVTMGPKVSEETQRLFKEDQYSRYVKLHGLGVEMAEALAEYWHKRIREEWGFVNEDGPTLTGLFRQQYRGGRYSWGYPACPNLEDNQKVADLLDAKRIGIEVSEGFQLHPEQSTLAIICHHPQAKYFVA
jgi:5-methyltetrahydrofolate--homocysteine methyltransferase